MDWKNIAAAFIASLLVSVAFRIYHGPPPTRIVVCYTDNQTCRDLVNNVALEEMRQ